MKNFYSRSSQNIPHTNFALFVLLAGSCKPTNRKSLGSKQMYGKLKCVLYIHFSVFLLLILNTFSSTNMLSFRSRGAISCSPSHWKTSK